jgi:hypothetical protein
MDVWAALSVDGPGEVVNHISPSVPSSSLRVPVAHMFDPPTGRWADLRGLRTAQPSRFVKTQKPPPRTREAEDAELPDLTLIQG